MTSVVKAAKVAWKEHWPNSPSSFTIKRNINMRLFCNLNPHLRQLRVTLKIEVADGLLSSSSPSSHVLTLKCDNSDMIICHEEQDVIRTSIVSFPSTVLFESFEEEIPITDLKDGMLSFSLRNVKLSPQILLQIKEIQEKRQGTKLKTNPDLMNDWIFCHSHGSSHDYHCQDIETNATEEEDKCHLDSQSNKKNEKRNLETEDKYCLESLEELLSFLSTQTAGSKLLLQTSDPKREDSLFLDILSPMTHVMTASLEFGKNCSLQSQVVCLFHFTDISLRKICKPGLREDTLIPVEEDDDDKRRHEENALRQQLKCVRLSFETEWLSLREDLFSRTRHLITSSTFLDEVTTSSSLESLPYMMGFLVLWCLLITLCVTICSLLYKYLIAFQPQPHVSTLLCLKRKGDVIWVMACFLSCCERSSLLNDMKDVSRRHYCYFKVQSRHSVTTFTTMSCNLLSDAILGIKDVVIKHLFSTARNL